MARRHWSLEHATCGSARLFTCIKFAKCDSLVAGVRASPVARWAYCPITFATITFGCDCCAALTAELYFPFFRAVGVPTGRRPVGDQGIDRGYLLVGHVT
ncbi:unnamed protein product [Ostreobium quekettii]|uniref:Uncharacterized protein n=1 Tax=Ostreobium quekettii TaxID=121088 RepID=A0A8S1JFM3_9CHLO|nr:unnamed protein product [Ostreobium quekettii]